MGQVERKQINMLNVKDRVTQLRLNHVFNIKNEKGPEHLKSNFNKFSDIHAYNTRGSATNFRVPKIKGEECRTFFYNAICEWNKLPTQLKNIIDKTHFKKAVKKFLVEQDKII